MLSAASVVVVAMAVMVVEMVASLETVTGVPDKSAMLSKRVNAPVVMTADFLMILMLLRVPVARAVSAILSKRVNAPVAMLADSATKLLK